MKRQFLISLFVLFFVSGFAGAADLQWSGVPAQLNNSSAAYKPDELIVRFADLDTGSQPPEGPVLIGPLTRRAIRSRISDYILAGAAVDKEYDYISPGVAVVKLPAGTNVLEAGIKFLQSANVIYAEPNYKYTLFAVPNDPFFPDLWGLNNTGQKGGTDDADMDAPEAWDITTGSSDIVVAVIDAGIDYRHPDLAANMWINAAEKNGTTGVDDDNNGYIDDIYGYDFAGPSSIRANDGRSDPKDVWYHGTHVAGIIGAAANNAQGVAGVCWNVKLMALKIYADDYYTFKDRPEAFASDAILAIQYAIDNGARIINASWGGKYDSQLLKEAIRNAGNAGVLFVTAAGNDYGSDNDETPVYPASYDLDNIISVMSTDPNDMMSNFSNYGASSVDVAAPGTDIVSTTPTAGNFAMTVYDVSTNYDMLSGTSQSTAYVSGACALVWSHYPALPKEVIKGLLMKTVDPVLTTPMRCLSGGRVNLYNSLTLIPSGKPGRVINTKNPEHLYNTIQAAIDEAVDGDELIAEAGTLFFEGIDFDGKAITLRSGDINEPVDANISPENTVILGMLSDGSTVTFANNEGPGSVLRGFTISRGAADYGGGIRCDGASPTIIDCIITNNTSKYYGAGIDCTNNSSPIIRNCMIASNRTSGSNSIGGGINCEDSSPAIENCVISYNYADNVGGGIACYNSNPTIFNCVIANNSAVYKSGGIDLENSSPVITNCTIVVDDPNAPKDGGIFAYQNSSPVITNCIFWGNGDDLYNCSATYSCIDDDDSGKGNIHVKPMFVTGPLGNYYLSQKSAGQLNDSSGVDVGDPATDPNLKLDSLTTRTDGVTDAGVVDMGVHYKAVPAKPVRLNITVVGGGKVEPGSGDYRQYEVVQIKADPNDGYRIKSWTGTEDDSSKEPVKTLTMVTDVNVTVEFEKIPLYQLRTEVIGSNGTISPYHRRGEYYPEGTVITLIATPDKTYGIDKWTGTDDDTSWSTKNTVTINSDKEVTILFRQPRSLHVPGQYPTIADAINAAYDHGDKVIVSAGNYPGIPGGFDFQGKAITVASEHPDDPASVAATIIDCGGTTRAFIFQSGEGNDSVVDGFTIINGSGVATTNPPSTGGTGGNGQNAFGGAITCLNGASPTLSNLIISNSTAYGQNGEDASFVFPAPQAPPDPPDPLDPNAPFPPYPDIDPNDGTTYDPNNVATWDPNDPWDPSMPWDPSNPHTPDPGSAIDGQDGQNGANGLDGQAGADGANGANGYKGGGGGLGYGGAMYFDANCAPIILHCTITDCNAVGGNGGFGGQGQNGQDGQDGQDGQPGQDGQDGQANYNDGADGAGGNGGNGGAGGPGGRGGDAGKGGDGGSGAEALGGAIYFGPNCRPTIRHCTILNCTTNQGIGSRGGFGGVGGTGGEGAEGAEGGAGGSGSTDGADGTGNTGTVAPGGDGGNGGNGGNASPDGARTWAGAIYFGENCEVDISDTIIANNATTTIPRIDPFDPNAPGYDPNAFQPGTGGAPGTDGAAGGPGSAGSSSDPSSVTTFGGGNYYEPGVKIKMTNCIIANNSSEQHDGGGEYYSEGSTGIFNQSELVGNTARYGAGQFFDPCCSIEVQDCEYGGNTATRDGGGLFIRYECTLNVDDSKFNGNMALGSGGGVYGGGEFDPEESVWYNNSKISVQDTEFYRNLAGFGGGLYWHGEDSEVTVSYCKFDDNTADAGGGLYFSRGAPKIIGCTITNNDADYFDPNAVFDIVYGGGGGIVCWSSNARIEDCIISDNSSSGSGGGVYLGGNPSAPLLKNCLIKENSASIDGGGIVANWFVEPTISNCSIINNMASDSTDAAHGRGGGLSCTYETKTTLINSILWLNRSVTGNQIAIGSETEPVYLDRPATLTVSYCDVQGGRTARAVHVEPRRTLNWLDGNINADPLFVAMNYLSQTEAGQAANSPCVDAGSNLAENLGMDLYTTRTDRVADAGVVDMGYHYTVRGHEQELILVVVGPGTVEADIDSIVPSKTVYDAENQTYTFTFKTYRDDVVRFTATPDKGYRVKSWTGTNKDPSWNTNTNVLTVDGSEMVRVEFEPDVIRLLKVPTEYRTIEQAVQAADQHGTRIIVDRGVHYVASPDGIDFQGKNVTLMSTDPDDPDVIANTIIDCQGARLSNNRAFHFHSGEDFNTKVTGFTIRNGYINGGNGVFGRPGVLTPLNYTLEPDPDPDPINTPPRAEEGAYIMGDAYGGGILCENGSSPTIENCIITNCTVTGAHGGDGADGQYVPYGLDDYPDEWSYISPYDPDAAIQTSGDGQWGGYGGDGEGNGYGGAIACLTGSCPVINNCIISNNNALGGMGGTSGDGGTSDSGAASGGGSGGWAYGDGIGGGIYSDNQSCPIITDCNFVNNIAATGIPGQGGAMGPGGDHDPPATPGSMGMEVSYGGIAGGAAYFDDSSNANFTGCTFTDNKAYMLDSNFGVTAATFTYTRGGVLYSAANNTVTLKNCKLTGNLGGAVYCSTGCTVDIDGCSLIENAEAAEGGAIYIAERAQMDVNETIFSGNSALADGGAIRTEGDADFTDCTFIGNIAAENGGAIDAYYNTGNPEVRVMLRLNFESCSFSGNQAVEGLYGYGGGLHLEDFEAKFNNCYIINNTAKSGGGLLLTGGKVDINGGAINANKSIGGSGIDVRIEQQILDTYLSNPYLFDDYIGFYFDDPTVIGEFDYSSSHNLGGGLVCADTAATIESCTFSNNVTGGDNGSGGAINFYGGFVNHSLKNCLFTGNSANGDGGAISCNLFAKPEIQNCTFSDDRTNGDYIGGAIFCDWSSDATISNSIFQSCNNGAIAEEESGDTTVKYSLFHNNTDGDYGLYDTISRQVSTSTGAELNATNIEADPMFVAGPLSKYYLSQLDSGQTVESPAVNAGSNTAAESGLSDFTTRTDGAGDLDVVDLGYHHVDHTTLLQYELTAGVINGSGSISPVSGMYYSGTLVTLNAVPNYGWRVAGWTGTITDTSRDKTNYVLMNSNKNVGVIFDQPRHIVVGSDADYTSIMHAINDANDGDIVILPPGEYNAPASHLDREIGFERIEIHDKKITITGSNPDDPNVVAATILDNYWFHIYNVGPDTIIDGITIRNSQRDGLITADPDGSQDGPDGFPIYGGAMQIINASPTIRNCVFTDCSVTGGDADDGDPGVDPGHVIGYDGGWAGKAYGGAVYCVYKSNPTFENCAFTNNIARGGNGGNGGTGANGTKGGRGGNWVWSDSMEEEFAALWWDGWEWGDKAGGTPYDAYQDPYWKYSGYGGAVYCENQCSPRFLDCRFENNHTYGGVCGVGGGVDPNPDRNLKIDNAGGAVYASLKCNPEFINCTFIGNSADRSNNYMTTGTPGTLATVIGNDDPYISYGGAIAFEDDCSPKFTNCTITDNEAAIGGAMYWSKSSPSIVVCDLSDNTAFSGAGLYSVNSTGSIENSFISQNTSITAVDPNLSPILGQGGGYYCLSSTVRVMDTSFISNLASGSGGGIYIAGSDLNLSVTPTLHNCLVANNSAGRDGGGVSANWNAEPIISNCTIANNTVLDGYGGGLFCGYDNDTTVIDSIFWNNDAQTGEQIAVTTGFLSEPRPSKLSISYSDVEGGQAGVFVDTDCILEWSESNIETNPLFVTGSFGGYYLSQFAAGQLFNSLCVDAGSGDVNDPGIGMSTYTTRTDGVADSNTVDMGYHYRTTSAFMPRLIVTVVDANGPITDPNLIHGYVDPNDQFYSQGTVVQLTAYPDPKYRIKAWTGTDNDSSTARNNTVTMTEDKYVTIEFELGVYQLTTIVVGGHGSLDPNSGTQYAGVIQLTAHPDEGYRVKSWMGTDKDVSWDNINTVTLDSNKTVRVEFEPDVIRILKVPTEYRTIEEAIIAGDQLGTKIVVDRGIYHVTSPSGIDFAGKNITLMSTDPDNPAVIASTIIDCNGARLNNGRAFYFHSGEDKNTKVIGFTIRNGYINGGNGSFGRDGVFTPSPYELQPTEDEPDPNETPPRAERGADIEGDGYGGGILCENGSSPMITNCIITNCTVTGAHGGDGADGLFRFITGMDREDMPDEWQFIPPTADPADDPATSGDGQWGGHAGAGTGNGYGGAIACLSGSSPIITNCIIRDNSALGGMGGTGGNGGTTSGGSESGGGYGGDAIGDGIGGGIYNDNQSCPIITDCKFENNIAATGTPGEGGDVGTGDALDPPAQPGATGDTQSNGGIAGGAAYFDDNSDAKITNSTFSGNKAYELITSPFADILGLSTEPMFTYTRGGALYSTSDNAVILKGCEFTGNLGGAVYCSSGCTLDVNDCSFDENAEAVAGSAIYIDESVRADVKNTKFLANSALGDGGAIYTISNADFTECSFANNIAGENGGAIEAYFDTNNPDIHIDLSFNFNRCSFTRNRASQGVYGWGGALHLQDFNADFKDCFFINNTAKSGGGMFLSSGTVTINGGVIKGNKSIGGSGISLISAQDLEDYLSRQLSSVDFIASYYDSTSITESFNTSNGIGGGLACANTTATIENCTLSDNTAEGVNGSGGAINFYGGLVSHKIKNCLLTGNSSAENGGAISSNLFSMPEIRNCTFSNNKTNGMGGAVFSDWSSGAILTDSIFQRCNKGAIADGYKDFKNSYEAEIFKNTTVEFCLFHNNTHGDYKENPYRDYVLYDPNSKPIEFINYPNPDDANDTNIKGDPLFINGPLGGFYLSHVATGQNVDSPAVDAGSDDANNANIGLSDYTTRIDGQADTGKVDIGYHYRHPDELPTYTLTARVASGQGSIEPVSGTYKTGTTVTLTAKPAPSWRVSKWSGTDNDSSKQSINTVTIAGADAFVEVEFWQPTTIHVPGQYQTIQDAVTAAHDGDNIIVDTGVYYGGYSSYSLLIDKSVNITSRDPHDPNTVAATIIRGNRGVTGWNYIGVVFRSTTDANTVLNGFTIEDFGGNWGDGDDGDRDQGHPNGEDGAPGEGAGIYIEAGARPVIKNCIIRNNYIYAGDGGNGVGADENNNAGRGGWGGWARGAGIYCGPYTNPTLINCTIEGNIANGGSGGNGGNYADPGGFANYGGNYSREGSTLNPVYDYAPTGISLETVVGHLWQVWEWDFAFIYGLYYGQTELTSYIDDYRWYSGYGAGVFCDIGTNVTFDHCEIRGNRTVGGMSGQGGVRGPSGRLEEPIAPYELPSYGGGVYCAANTNVTFDGCTFEDNIASETPVDPNHRLSPYIGYGGGVSAERNAVVSFTDCNFVDNQADSGGGIYVNDTSTTIVDCNITSNTALRGGGFLGIRGSADVKGSIFANNQAESDVNDPNDDDVLSIGAGLCFWSVDADVFDCIIRGNRAGASGGGIYLRGEIDILPDIRNCLIINNSAGRDGGGISTNWSAIPTIANCTFSGNAASGTEGERGNTGLGGALYCGYESVATVIDSIFWNNYGLKGQEIAVGSGFESDPMRGSVMVYHSDVKSSLNNLWIEPGCVLSLKSSDGNIDDDPLFVNGYYLRQTSAGQERTSPCVNRGSDYASHVGLLGYTTRTDHVRDTDKVDMGYHYNTEDKCRFADFVFDGVIDLRDYDKFAQILGYVDFEVAMEKWLEEPLDLPSSEDNEWRSGTDITTDRHVDSDDLDFLLIVCKDVSDTNAPTPNPSEWDKEPYISSSSSISMEAKQASDAWSRDVKYYFDCITPGGHDSGWQDSPIYTDTGINIGTGYGYRVRAKDKFDNMTEWSQLSYSGIDTIPPAPAPYIESIDANSPTSITMVATVAYDYSGVEYYFENTHGNGHDSGWQTEPNFTDVNLAPDAEYGYRVKARDRSDEQNETGWSETVYIRTLVSPDTEPPQPNPMEWDPTVDANGFDGTPREVYGGGVFNDYSAEMIAVTATDASGPVEYFFECTTEHGFNSGWIQTPTYSVPIGRSGQLHRFRVRARDQYGNMTAWSDEEVTD